MCNDAAVQRLAAIVRASQDAIFEVAHDGRITSWNPGAERLFGYGADDALGLPLTALVPQDRLHEAEWTLGAARSGVVPEPYDTVRVHHDGALVPVSIVVSPVQGPEGVRSAAVIARDLRPLARTRAELTLREARFRALVERAGEMFTICSPDGTITYASPRPRTPGGRDPANLVGMNAFDMIRAEDQPVARAALASFCAKPGPHEPVTFRGVDTGGGDRWYRLVVTNLVDDPAVGGLVVVVRDVTAERQVEEELALYAKRDRVTGLPTRSALPDLLDRLRDPDGACDVAVVLVEVEGLEDLRRSVGQVAADEARRTLAARLREVAGEGDVAVRVGNDAYALLRAGVDNAGALRLAERVVSAVGEPVEAHGTSWPLSATAGVAVSATADADALLRDADVARFEARSRGPGHAEAFTPALDRSVAGRIELISSLRHGLSQETLRLDYQPAVRLTDGAAVGAEALLRWRDPDGHVQDTATFLAAAGANGLMPAIGEWVLRTACAEAASWGGDDAPYVGVNVSARELTSPRFTAIVEDALSASGLAPRRLVLEVHDPAALGPGGEVATAVAAMGVRLAVDSFGTGQGSLLYLRRLPVSMVKVSRDLVAGLCQDEDDEAIVASVLNLAAAVGVDAVAVGIENEAQRDLLAQLGCAVAQGFLLGRPAGHAPDATASTALPRPGERRRRTGPSLDPVVVARIRSLTREGASLHTIAAALNAEHLAHPKERRWHPRAVAQALATAPELTEPRERWTVL